MNLNELKELEVKALQELQGISDEAGLESWKVQYLGRKSALTSLLRSLKELDPKDRAIMGKEANQVRIALESALEESLRSFHVRHRFIDPTIAGREVEMGTTHLIWQAVEDIHNDFKSLGFVLADGPEAETEEYNFDLLNIPENHPARDEWDTFWLKKEGTLLRTHTSPVQVRYMKSHKPPFRILVPGKTYRYEAEDASHASVFHQIEGLMIEEGLTLAHFKAIVAKFVESALGDIEWRLRPSFFPFTEPSFEIDVKWNGKWLELAGGGMTHPKVIANAGLDPKKYSGIAFGAGLERIVMAKYGITDIRELSGIKPHMFKLSYEALD